MNLYPCKAILIGCGSEKRTEPSPARDLYTSIFFRTKRAYAEATGMPWAILSAEYGVVRPDSVVHPYEKSADNFTRWERREWAAGTALQIFEWQRYIRCIAIIAGDSYLTPLAATLAALDVKVVNPCAGLGIGQQMAFLRQATEAIR